ncbi:MAG: hypothetical protein ABIO94_10375 [Opitutaceae bacterium]
MQTSPENHEQRLERLIRKTLRELPARRAPASLEQRVLAEIERRAARPWWQKSYPHWPLVARCGFLIGSAAVLKIVIMAAVWVLVGFESAPFVEAFSTSFAWLQALTDLAESLWQFCAAVLSTVPRFWLYAGAVCFAAMYATLFGLGAFAYRVFHGKSLAHL